MSGLKVVIKASSLIEKISEEELDEEVMDYLKNVKDRKLMSKQDKLAILTAAKAWRESKIAKDEEILSETGIYFCVGILPFIDKELEKLAKLSQKDGKFDEELFSTSGFNSMNPLLTFKCLPNMPLFHISFNLDITGRYMMSYPNSDDFLVTLERAIDDLKDGQIKAAIVGAACDQQNILVKHHLARLSEGLEHKAVDCSASLILEHKVPSQGEFYIEEVKAQKSQVNYLDDLYYGPVALGREIILGLANGNEFSNKTITIRRQL